MDRTGATRVSARLRWTLGFALVVLAACERRSAPRSNDTAVPVVTPPDSAPVEEPVVESAWDASAGPALLVPGTTPQEAGIVVPAYTDTTALDSVRVDASAARGLQVELFSRGGTVGRATVTSTTPGPPPRQASGCAAWPSAQLAPAEGSLVGRWTVGFAAGRAEAIPTDSIETMSSADSTRLTSEIARLASSLPNDTAQAFRGLPFVVRGVRRFELAPGVEVLLTEVLRSLNVEASPRQEQLLILAERDSTTAGRWVPGYVERTSGTEEELVSTDVLAAVRLGASHRPTLVLGRDYGDGMSYSLLERVAPHRWRVRWTSAYAGC
jgi:hypothetical protein